MENYDSSNESVAKCEQVIFDWLTQTERHNIDLPVLRFDMQLLFSVLKDTKYATYSYYRGICKDRSPANFLVSFTRHIETALRFRGLTKEHDDFRDFGILPTRDTYLIYESNSKDNFRLTDFLFDQIIDKTQNTVLQSAIEEYSGEDEIISSEHDATLHRYNRQEIYEILKNTDLQFSFLTDWDKKFFTI